MKFIGLAITVHALCMAFTFSDPREGPRIGMFIAGLFLVISLLYFFFDSVSKKVHKAREGSR